MPDFPQDYPDRKLKDFFHGQRLFGANNNRLVPKSSFLYHVFFEINSSTQKTSFKPTGDLIREVGMLVKSVELPKFDIESKEMNAYNQHINVQTGIKYLPVKIDFHDDSANVVRDFWEDYMTYYYGDSYNTATTAETISVNRYVKPKSPYWGYLPRDDRNYLTKVKIYSLSKKQYSLYTLVNPFIDSWNHGIHTAGQSDFLGHSMSLRYEYVLYESGDIRDPEIGTNIPGFGGGHYDNIQSTLTQQQYSEELFGIDRPAAIDNFRKAAAFDLDPFKRYEGISPRRPQSSTLASRLRDRLLRAGQSVVNTAIIKAENRLLNSKIGNSTITKILRPGIGQVGSSLSNSIFPSPYK